MEIAIVKNKKELYINNKKKDLNKSYCFLIGNIYNLDDLNNFNNKLSLEKKILKLYNIYGQELFKKLNGEFALILIINGQIILVRDGLGSKNLYYYQEKGTFICTNNLANIIKIYSKKLKISHQQLSNFLVYDYIQAPYTIFEDVYKLQAGTALIYEKKVTLDKYYNIENEYCLNKNKIKNESEALKELESKLLNALKLRIKDKEKIGVLLSAGIDSTLISSLLKKLNVNDLNTYTVGFFDEERNEATNAKEIAQYLKTCHHEYYLKEEKVLAITHKIPFLYADLLSDPSIIPIIFLNDKIKNEDIDVFVSGDGADQLFCGSNVYDTFFIKNKVKGILKYSNSLMNNEKYSYQDVQNIYRMGVSRDSVVKQIIDVIPNGYSVVSTKHLKPQIKFMLNDIQTFLANRLFLKQNISSTHYDLAVTHPFIDNDLVETSLKLNHKFKYNHRNKKYILKKLLDNYIPQDMLNKSKKGFGIPLKIWIYTVFKDDILKYSQIKDLKNQRLFKINSMQDLLNKLKNNSLSLEEIKVLFSYYIFQLWYYTYIDKLEK